MGILQNIIDSEKHRGLTERVWGFFNFINIMWLVAIAGITVSIGPAVYHLTEPLRKWLKRVCIWIYDNVVVPFFRFCHENYIFEVAGYVGCFNFIVEGMNLPAETGMYVSLTGYALLTLCLSYTTFLRGAQALRDLHSDLKVQLFALYFSTLLVPAA